jgi:divalent metal cation (Fe/Co/Zn/Cd) transporter
VPGLTKIVTHLEPTGDATAIVHTEPANEATVRSALEEFFRGWHIGGTLHNITALRAGGELQVSFHFRLDAKITIADAHELTVKVEDFLRSRIPDLGRVVIHVEPEK